MLPGTESMGREVFCFASKHSVEAQISSLWSGLSAIETWQHGLSSLLGEHSEADSQFISSPLRPSLPALADLFICIPALKSKNSRIFYRGSSNYSPGRLGSTCRSNSDQIFHRVKFWGHFALRNSFCKKGSLFHDG